MVRAGFLLSVVLLAAACSSGNAYLIVPGQSLGPLRIGMTQPQAEKAMSDTFDLRPVRVGRDLCWHENMVCAGFCQAPGGCGAAARGTVATIRLVRNVQFATRDGVKISTPGETAVEKLSKSLGVPTSRLRVRDGELVAWKGLTIGIGARPDGSPVVRQMLISF